LLTLTVGLSPVDNVREVETALNKESYLIHDKDNDEDSYYKWFYNELKSDASRPGYEVFKKALAGYFNLKYNRSVTSKLLTIIDYSLSSNQERMWIVDMNNVQVVHSSLVAHGRNSGQEFANSFSNISGSHQSSLGFYLTEDIYQGKHGTSLYLNGLEPGINDNARQRTIVMHSASYVSREFIHNNARLGRSFGCPAIPLDDHENIITLLSGGSTIYIHHTDETYHGSSLMFCPESAYKGMLRFLGEPLPAFRFPG
jgi:hypothetical protein